MKNKSYLMTSLVIFSIILSSSIVTVRGTTYTCTGVVDAEATWKVKTIHKGALTDIFGVNWSSAIESSFGPGSNETGARMKTTVTFVNSSFSYDFGLGPFDICLILSNLWTWTTQDFVITPDVPNAPTWIFMHPENLTAYCQAISFSTRNVSQLLAYPFLNGIPIPAATFLSELIWDNDYSVKGTTVTHDVTPPYIGLGGIYSVVCTETWRYSSSYGTFLGYKLVHNNGTIAYETILETPSKGGISGFEIPLLLGASIGVVVSLIYVVMRKKR